MDIDEAFTDVVGECGFMQRKLLFILATMQTVTAFQMIHMVFIGAEPEVVCITTENVVKRGCGDVGDVCKEYRSQSPFTSVATQWQLYCGKSYLVGIVQSVYMCGVLCGALIFGILSDKYGRRGTMLVSLVGMSAGAFLSSFAPTLMTYMFIRFITGVFGGAVILISFAIATEIVGPAWRAFVGVLMPGFFGLGIMLFAMMAYLVREWRVLSVYTAVPAGISLLLTYWLIPESPRWLFSQGRLEDAESVLETIAKQNGQQPSKNIQLRVVQTTKSPNLKYSLLDLVRNSVLRWRTISLVFSWLVNSCLYYGLTMSAGNLGSNMYMSVALSGLVEIPAYIITYPLLQRLGRRISYSGFMLAGGAACFGIVVVPKSLAAVITALALVGKCCISASFAVAFLYTAELYPTIIRNNGMGLCSMSARFGGVISPMIITLESISSSLPYIIFGSMALTAGIWSVRLPETLNQPMPETVDDLVNAPNKDVESRQHLLREMQT